MSTYVETKKELDRIRKEYGCKGDIIFRSAIQCVVEYGADNLTDDWNYAHTVDDVNRRHDDAEVEGRTLWISRDFELAILECAREISKVNTYDFLIYIQREIWLSNEGIDYERAIELLKKCMYDIEERENCENKLLYQSFEQIGFDDYEIESLGFDYLIADYKEEE
jgi:hypothetical protein